MALCLYGCLGHSYKKTPRRNGRSTPTTTRRVRPYRPRYPRRKRSLPQTRKVCLRAKRNRLPRSHCRTRHPKDGPKEDTRGSGLVSANHCHRGAPIPGIHGVLPVLHPELFKNRPTTFGPHKKDDPLALGPTPTQSIRNSKNPHVSETCSTPAQLRK